MEFDKVKKEHILQGIKDFEEKGYPEEFGPSSTYDINYASKKYPPKAIMAYANYHATGKEIKRYFKGGLGTDCFKSFKRNGFEIVKKVNGKDTIESYLQEFSEIADAWFAKESWLQKWYDYYQKFFTKENLQKAAWEDFQDMGNHIHSFNSMAIAKKNALGNTNLPIEEYRRIFKYLVSGDDPINVTINNLYKKYNGSAHLPSFSDSSISELIAYAFPNEYVLYNRRDVKALEILGLKLDHKRGEKFGDLFLRYNEFLKPVLEQYQQIVGKRTNTTIQLETDQFFSWLYINKKADKPIRDLIKNYKELIKTNGLKQEQYKWELIRDYKGKPNLENNIYDEIKSIKFSNVIYHLAVACIKEIAKDFENELTEEFRILRDESVDLNDRINRFNKNTLKLYKKTGGENSHHQDERSISVYLTLTNPEEYTFYKSSYYQEYCKRINEKPAKPKLKYSHYLELIKELAENYIASDEELISLVGDELNELVEHDANYLLLAQDILYQMLDVDRGTNYWIFQGNPKVFDFETALNQEILTDWTVSAHKEKIKVGDKVILWITGNKSGCYGLAEVTSEPYTKTSSPDDHLWKEDDNSELKAKIKINHNLVNSPILKEQIDELTELKDLKVGNQGTNFLATEEEYNTLLSLTKKMNNNKYWLYAPGENASKWDEFYENGIMGLGWDEIGDLNKLGDKEALTKTIQTKYNTDSKSYNNALANLEFRDTISEGDIIIPKKGRQDYLGYGIVRSDYYYDASRDRYQKCRKVEWKKKGVWPEPQGDIVLKTLTDITKYPDYVEKLIKLIGIEKEGIKTNTKTINMNIPLNTILYGPPGTGKTYNTINKSLEIIGENLGGKSRQDIKTLFDAKMKEGQIVFTTFHQSMSYEDFVEGIKPIEPDKEGDPVIYRIEYGLFRKLCIEASFAIAQLRETKTTEEVLDFSILYDKFAESIEEKLLNGEQVLLKTRSGGSIMVDGFSQHHNFIIRHPEGKRTYLVSKTRLTKLQSAIKNLDDVGNINDQFREIIGGCNSSAYWSILNAIKKEKQFNPINKEIRTYTFDDKTEVVLSLAKTDYINKNGKPFVLIIDEINRGNVSQIFGELITLIEDDKRLGRNEAMEATLPYSKAKFGVPNNIHIIGTMNTADRSVEALDTALRRRFSFMEMPPIPDLIKTKGKLKEKEGILDGIDLALMLTTINHRIEKLLDKDHMIGHSYLLEVDTLDALRKAFNDAILPLLKEYFFGDLGKIGLVVGPGFVNKVKPEDFSFAKGAEYDDGLQTDLKEREVYSFTAKQDWDIDTFKKIYE